MTGMFREEYQGSRSSMPEPLPLVGESIAAEEYPVEALGQVMGGALEAIVRHAFVPPSMAANSLLSAASLAVQPYFSVKLPTSQIRPVSLFLVTVATTGDRKSTADGFAIEEIETFQRELHERHDMESHEADAKRTAWANAKSEAVKSAKGQGSAAIEAALRDLGPEPQEAMRPIILVRAGTTQGLLKYFDKARPSLGLMSDEGGSWLGGYGMSEDQRLFTIATLSDLWDGKPVQRLTGGEGATMLYGRRLTFHLMIQPVLSGRLLGDAEMKGQGFLSRLLVAQPPSLAGQRIVDPAAMDMNRFDNEMDRFRLRLSEVIRAPLPIDPEKGVLTPRVLEFTPEAAAMWWAFYNQNEARIGPGGDLADVSGFVGKLPEQAARLAAVLGIFEVGVRLPAIDATLLARGIALAEFYLAEANRLFGVATISAEMVHAQVLSDWLRDTWKENLISIRVISTRGPNSIRKLNADGIRPIVEALVRNNHLSQRLPEGGMVSGKHVNECWRVMVKSA